MFGVIFLWGDNMSYIALYRKYRPNTFESIVGQESVTKILKNQIKSGKISHAYIFSGTRGTGKTSAAKVFARAVNCLNPKDGEPCNECEVCKNILESHTTDVIEMDAASNNSVENIRQIRQEVVYTTIDVKYRVYIIDEAHMLTTSAFNALLKTLEEPPKNVIFILATTEQHKIPVTILSRCLRFDFNKISDEEIIKRVEYVLKEENIKYEEEAIKYIAKLAEGGLRDALSILDRCISESKDILKYDEVLKIVGAVDLQIVSNIAGNILALNSIEALSNIDKVVKKGKDLGQLTHQLTENFLEKLINQDGTNVDRYIKIIDRLSKLDNDLRLTSKPIIVLKSAIVEICNVNFGGSNNLSENGNISVEPLMQKISSLENEIEKLKSKIESIKTNTVVSPLNIKKVSDSGCNSNSLKVNTVDKYIQNNNEVVDEKKLESFVDVENFKKCIIEKGKLKIYSSLAGANMYVDQKSLIIVTNNSFAYSVLITQDSIETLKNIYSENYNDEKNIVVRLQEEKKDNSTKIEKVFKENEVNYTSID